MLLCRRDSDVLLIWIWIHRVTRSHGGRDDDDVLFESRLTRRHAPCLRQKIFTRLLLPSSVAKPVQSVGLCGRMELVLISVSLSWWSIAGLSLLAIFAVAAVLDPLISLIIHPIILPYPWPLSSEEESGQTTDDSKRMVVFAASFNPPHKGHLAMLEYLARRYGSVWVVIGRNPDKLYDVSPDQRAELVRTMLRSLDQDSQTALLGKVQVKVVEGYIWRTVQREGAEIFFRGIRSWEKDGHEERALQILNTWGPLVLGPFWWPIPTVFLQGDPALNHISSTLIRETCQDEPDKKKMLGKLDKLVPNSILHDVASLYGKTKKMD